MRKFFGYLLLLTAATAIITAPLLLTYKQVKPMVARPHAPPLPALDLVMEITNAEVIVIRGNIVPKLTAEQFGLLARFYPTNYEIAPRLTFYRDRDYAPRPLLGKTNSGHL